MPQLVSYSMRIILFLTMILAVFGCSPSENNKQPSSSSTDGKALYESNCADCHGIAGAGGTASALNTGKNPQDVANTTKNGISPVMPSYKAKFNDTQIQAIANYVAGLKK